MRTTPRGALIFGGLTLAFGLTACAPKVNRDDFESEVAKIREEMQTGDRQLATRIDSVDARVNALEQELQSFRSEYNVSVERMEGVMMAGYCLGHIRHRVKRLKFLVSLHVSSRLRRKDSRTCAVR